MCNRQSGVGKNTGTTRQSTVGTMSVERFGINRQRRNADRGKRNHTTQSWRRLLDTPQEPLCATLRVGPFCESPRRRLAWSRTVLSPWDENRTAKCFRTLDHVCRVASGQRALEGGSSWSEACALTVALALSDMVLVVLREVFTETGSADAMLWGRFLGALILFVSFGIPVNAFLIWVLRIANRAIDHKLRPGRVSRRNGQ